MPQSEPDRKNNPMVDGKGLDIEADLEKEVLAVVRRRLGRNFVSLLVSGSRANGDCLPDSDFDGIALVRRASRTRIDFPSLERRYGISIGVALTPFVDVKDRIRSRHPDLSRFHSLSLVKHRLGRLRLIGGRNPFRSLPPLKSLLARDLARELKEDYWAATLPGIPSNVFNREPRRHVGFVIAICDALLLAKGVGVKKTDLPRVLRRYHPKFRVLGILKRALWRRANWPTVSADRKRLRDARQDLKDFLVSFRRYAFALGGAAFTATDYLRHRRRSRG